MWSIGRGRICNADRFQRKQKINIWSSWVGAIREKVAEMWVGKEENKTQPEGSALSYHRWSCVGGLKKYFQDLTHCS